MSEQASSTNKKTASKKQAIKKDTDEISPSELIKAAAVLAKAYSTMGEADDRANDGDIFLNVSIGMRLGKSEPIVVEESRSIRAALVSPGIASAPEEVELALRQILLPLLKAVQMESSRRLRDEQGGKDETQNLGFKPSIPID